MSTPSAYHIGQQAANAVGKGFTKQRDNNAIESILTEAMNSGDPAIVQNSIGKILSQVSPERQGLAVQYLQNTFQNLEQKRQAEKAEKEGRAAAQESGYTYGAPPPVQAQQVKDSGKQKRLSGIYGSPNTPSAPMQGGGGIDSILKGSMGSGGQQVQPPYSLGQQPNQNTQPTQTPASGSPFKNMSDDQLQLYTGHPDKEVSEPAKAEAKLREEERKENRADQRDAKKETLKRRQEIATKADIAEQGIAEQEALLDLIDTGNIDDPTVATFLEAIPMNLGKRFLSNETVEYKAGLVNGYRALRNIFQGQTRVKEIEILEEKIADIYLTDDQKKSILKSSIKTLNYDVLRAEAAAEVEKKHPNLGALEFDRKVKEYMKPKLEALGKRVIDEQKSYIQDAENRKKIPLEYDDPEGRQILEQILKEAKGDRAKARDIAKKKGYIIGK